MLEQIINYLNLVITDHGAFGVFIGSLIEEIVVPIPLAFVGTGAGFFMMKGSAISVNSFQNLFLNIMLPMSAGVTIGSLFIYGLTYFLGKPAIDRYGKFLGVSWSGIQDAEERFSKENKEWLLILGIRAVPIIPSTVINAFCGIIRMNIKKYMFYTFLGTLIWAFILGVIGWQFGSLYQQYTGVFSIFGSFILVNIIL